MDPDACYSRWLHSSDQPEERLEAWQDLTAWLRSGGFEPKWTAYQKKRFLSNAGRTDAEHQAAIKAGAL